MTAVLVMILLVRKTSGRGRLEREVHICGNALKQCYTSREPVFLLHVRVQKLRSTAEDDLVAVVIVEEQLEVISKKSAHGYRWCMQ
jgi:hypothetical protein